MILCASFLFRSQLFFKSPHVSDQGRVKVSLQAGAPLTEEELVELAFHGEELPSPLGWVTVSLAEVRDLDQT